jgi:ceramide glucosyltransferase
VIVFTGAIALWGVVTFSFTCGAIMALRKMLARIRAWAPPSSWPAVTVLRPCEGLEPGLRENLLSSVTARYEGAREILILIPTRNDPAWAVAEEVRAEAERSAPSIAVRLLETQIATVRNRKVAQLSAGARVAAHEILVIGDSDLTFDDFTLTDLVRVLTADPRAGASSASPMDVSRSTGGDRASAALLTSTPHAFHCLKALAEQSGGAHVLCGAIVAIRRAVLDEVGGFSSLESYLGEDFELARRLHEKGYTIPTAPEPVRTTEQNRSYASVLRRFARWCIVTRRQRLALFATYLLFLGSTPLVIALSALPIALGAPLWQLLAFNIFGILVARGWLAVELRRAYRQPADPLGSLWALLVGETLICLATLRALGPPIIEWRGYRYRIDAGGLMTRV